MSLERHGSELQADERFSDHQTNSLTAGNLTNIYSAVLATKRNETRTFPRMQASRGCLQTAESSGEQRALNGPPRVVTGLLTSPGFGAKRQTLRSRWVRFAGSRCSFAPISGLNYNSTQLTEGSRRAVWGFFLPKWLDRKLSTRFMRQFRKREFARIQTKPREMQKNRWVYFVLL